MAEQVMYDGRWVSTATDLGKEVMKFEKPYVFQPYPKMLYKAARTPKGKVAVYEEAIDFSQTTWTDALLSKEQDRIAFFNRQNQLTVPSEEKHKAALNAGWRETFEDAVKHFEEREIKVGNAAAERAYSDSKMSEKAQAEVAEADQATEFHLPEIPEKPKKRKFFKSKG